MGSLYESVSGVSIAARLVTPQEAALKQQASVFVKTGAWLAGQITAQERERNEQSIDTLRNSIFSANQIINEAEANRDTNAESARQRFINKGMQDFQKANTQFNMAASGLGSAAGGGRSQRAYMENRAPGKALYDQLDEAGKGYIQFYDTLLKKEGDLAFKLQQGVTQNMSQYDKLKTVAQNYYNMEEKERGDVNLSVKETIRNLQELKAHNKMAAHQIIKDSELEGKAKKEVLDLMRQQNAGLDVQISTVRSLGNVVEAAGDAEKRSYEETNQVIDKATNSRKKDEQQIKQTEMSIKKMDMANLRFAENMKANVMGALRNYRGILLQTTMTLSVMYWRTSRLTQAFIEFDRELINAQSIWQTSDEQLYNISNRVVNFGTEYGIQYGKASEVLYQFASAGLDAAQSQAVLNDTLKLAMATQGDANTLGKLLIQVIAGFGLEMEQATELTDKFAHTINKSLIEWQDLSSSVKFAMPFFVSAGQSVDQLLGALQVLTNRALEAGIAGRGLRQALAEFTQHAEDNQAAFRKLGVEILDTDGSMRDLTDIAKQFNNAIGDGATDMDVMITLMEDLNIRGATAFVHLAQNADEFAHAVDDLKNSAGAATEMAEIQQRSLTNQIQILKNAITAPFLLADPMYVQEGYMNAFHKSLVDVIEGVQTLFYDVMPNGSTMLTETGFVIRDFVIRFVERLGDLVIRVGEIFKMFTEQGYANIDMLKLYFLPLTMLIYVLERVPPGVGKIIFSLYLLNKALALNQVFIGLTSLAWKIASGEIVLAVGWSSGMIITANGMVELSYKAILASIGYIAASMVVFVAAAYGTYKIVEPLNQVAKVLIAVAAAALLAWAAISGPASIGVMAATGLGIVAAGALIGSMAAIAAPYIEVPSLSAPSVEDAFGGDYEAYVASFEGYSGPEAFTAQGNQTTMVVDTLEVTGEANMDAAQSFYNATLVTE
jgi:TP901 family phage tail tape measure protein